MTNLLKKYQDLLGNECLPIQQQELDKVDRILRETGFCIIAGYHGSGKSSLARRYSHYRQPLRKVYCKNVVITKEVLLELEKDHQLLFLDSVTNLLYDEIVFPAAKESSKKKPIVLGVHIEPQNINTLFSQYQDNLVVVGSLNYHDAKVLASCPFDQEAPNLEQLLEYSGMRRRDLINLCIEAYSIRGDFSTESVEEGTTNLADKGRRVYKHIFEEHFTGQQRELIKRILAGEPISPGDISAEILLRTGIIKKEKGVFILNGKLLELIFRKVWSE